MSQYTKSGFSKPFGCCGRFKGCDLGKNAEGCFYRESDPETMLNCKAFQRNQKKEEALEKAFDLFEQILK
jgi:hypothetical protein